MLIKFFCCKLSEAVFLRIFQWKSGYGISQTVFQSGLPDGKAFQSGKRLAEEYARMAGYTNVRLLEVSETFQSYSPQGEARMVLTAALKDAATPIEPGQVGTGVTLTVKYEMTR